MEDNKTQQNTAPVAPASAAAPQTPRPAHSGQSRGPRSFGTGGGQTGGFGGHRKNPRKQGPREPRAKPEFDQKIISIRRVTRVASGGRRFSFSVALVAGNRKGQVGVGTGKAGDTSLAIDKAAKNAKKNMLKLKLTKEMSIPYTVDAKYNASQVFIQPAKGKGLIAGSSVRHVLELGGVKDVAAKLLSGSKNRLNNARVAIKALSEFDERKGVHVK